MSNIGTFYAFKTQGYGAHSRAYGSLEYIQQFSCERLDLEPMQVDLARLEGKEFFSESDWKKYRFIS